MEVCCLKMTSQRKQPRSVLMDTIGIPLATSSHDCGSLSRVIMVRKTDQRLINHQNRHGDPQCEIVTFETIQTYKGYKPDKTIVTKEHYDFNSTTDDRKSPSVMRLIHKNTAGQSNASTLTSSLNDIRYGGGSEGGGGGSSELRTKSYTSNSNEGKTSSGTKLNLRQKSISPPTRHVEFDKFVVECFKAHNEYRNKHGVPPLKLNLRLCKFASEWAINLATRGNLIHRSNSPYGENIFCSWSSSSNDAGIIDGRAPVEHWYSEAINHVFGKEPTTLRTGHFTQVIWKDSRELGVGQARNKSGQVIVVANYDPPGNFIGSFTENVPPPGGFSTVPKIITSEVPGSTDISILSSGYDEVNEFAIKMLKFHNYYRKKHGVPDLKLSLELCQLSQDWAETLAREDRFAYRPNCSYGENIYCLWSSDRTAKVSPKEVCRSWYENHRDYDYLIEPKGIYKAGYFTQMLWKSTKELGVGLGKTKKGKVLVVCNYHPRGNIIGEFLFNVMRPH